jgi:hypothetical protein
LTNLGKELGRTPPESIVRARKKQDDCHLQEEHAVASTGSGARKGIDDREKGKPSSGGVAWVVDNWVPQGWWGGATDR